MPAGKQTGKYARKVGRKGGRDLDRKKLYMLGMPSYDKASIARSVRRLPVFAPHDLVEDLVDDKVVADLKDTILREGLPPNYLNHPVVQSHPDELVLPLNLYLDGVPYSHTDSVLGVWLENVVDGRRVLVAVIRKRLCCRCGCRHWCSLDALFRFLA